METFLTSARTRWAFIVPIRPPASYGPLMNVVGLGLGVFAFVSIGIAICLFSS